MKGIRELKGEINFADYLEHKLGYTLVAKESTKRYLFYRNGDDKILLYNRSGNNADFFYTTLNNSSDKGDIFTFLVRRNIVSDLKEALRLLNGVTDYQAVSRPVFKSAKKVFVPLNVEPATAESYIFKERHIPFHAYEKRFLDSIQQTRDVIIDIEFSLPSTIFWLTNKENVRCGQYLRNKRFKHFVEGSDKTNGLWRSPGELSCLAVFEDALDAISHYVLFPDFKGCYVATGGSASGNVVNELAKELMSCPGSFLAGDNDAAGQHMNLRLLTRMISLTDLTCDISFGKEHVVCEITECEASYAAIENLSNVEHLDGLLRVKLAKECQTLFDFSMRLIGSFGLDVKILRSTGKDFNFDLANAN